MSCIKKKKKNARARFGMISGAAAAWILINVVAASLHTYQSRLMSKYSSAGTIQA
jgi:hypothetical protein